LATTNYYTELDKNNTIDLRPSTNISPRFGALFHSCNFESLSHAGCASEFWVCILILICTHDSVFSFLSISNRIEAECRRLLTLRNVTISICSENLNRQEQLVVLGVLLDEFHGKVLFECVACRQVANLCLTGDTW